MSLADYVFVALGFACILFMVWGVFAITLTTRSIKRYRGTWQDDLFDEGSGEC